MLITNHTIYDENMINEGAGVLTKRYRIIVSVAAVVFLTLALIFIIGRGTNAIFTSAVYMIGFVCVLVTGLIRIKSYKKALFERIRVVNHTEPLETVSVVDEEKITTTTDSRTNILYHKDIKRINETSNLYVVIYHGGVFIFLAKSGFENNDEAEFRNLIGYKG